jgi:hypothetical protein
MEHREIQLAAVLSSYRASRHMAAPSLGHYASLSFVVRGRGQERFIRELGKTPIHLAPQKSLLPLETMSHSAEPVIPDEAA